MAKEEKMTNYGKAIGGILGTAIVIHTAHKYLLPATKKMVKQCNMKGGSKKRK